ncbi:MAG: TonB family protein [Candidatus Omnitrophica bacterium]|nr:TonB family protein [Candidatus Omnitrophota bacterium]
MISSTLCLAEDGPPVDAPASPEAAPPADTLSLNQGAIHTLSVEQIDRVAVGDPALLDVTVVSSNEVLLKAVAIGKTNVILWDRRGQHTIDVEIVDRKPEAMEAQIKRVLEELDLPGVSVRRESGKLFLTGEVSRQEELDQVEQMLSAFQGVTNLVTLPPPVPPPSTEGITPPLVRLGVQILEINHSDLEKLGVDWSDSMSVTEPAATDQTLSDVLFKWGTSLSRGSVAATINALVQQSKARILSEPKLVTASGKEASSFIGLEVPIVMATSFGTTSSTVSTSVEFRKTGVLLKMTPNVLPDGKITTVMEAEVSGIDTASGLNVPVGSQTVLVPGFKVRKTSTEVTTESGETIVIAGLLEAEDTDSMSQVPALGSIPVLGRLFRSPELKATQRELVIAVTPQMLSDAGQSDKRMALEQAMAVAEVTASVDDPKLRYALQVQDRIAKSIAYPIREREAGMGGRVKLRLHLFRDGTLGRAMIAESSGIESFDQEALKAAESQSPFPPFPSDLVQQDLWLDLPVLFRL